MKYVFIQPDMRNATWRTVWPAKELRRRGYDVDIYAMGTARPKLEYADSEVTFVLHFVNKAWRLDDYALTCADIAMQASEYGRVFLSFDDDWTRLLDIEPKPYNPLALLVHGQIPGLCMIVDRIIVATPRLKEVYGQFHPDVRVAENYLPTSVLDLSLRPRRPVLAWMGVMPVHGRDWNMLRPYAKDLPPLRLIGPGKWAADTIRGWGARHVEATDPTLDQRHLYRQLGEAQAAIVPLDTSIGFNLGKSWIKPYEFAARGVEAVSSACPEYDRMADLLGLSTYAEPADLVQAAVTAYERADGAGLPERIREQGMVMEQAGGDAWERAID